MTAPFTIGAMATMVRGDPAPWRAAFDRIPAMVIEDAVEPALLARLMAGAAGARFVAEDLGTIGRRRMEAPQRVGSGLSLLLGRRALLDWMERATGLGPLRALAGRLAETRAGDSDRLGWHDDLQDDRRQLAVVLNLSERPFAGGRFDLRRKGGGILLSYHHTRPGSLLVFAVDAALEHCVTPVIQGGPRRVYAGWVMTRPEHDDDPLTTPIFATAAR